jgi:CDP-glucose 4,6-dehydratase
MMGKAFEGFFSGKKVLITGHTGFKGSWLSRMMIGFGADVSGYSLRPSTKPNLFSILNLRKKMRNHFHDIRDYRKVLKAMQEEKPEIVIHMAAQPLVRDSYNDPPYTYETNVIGTVNVLQAIKEVGGVKAAVMITTDKVYENKETPRPYAEDDELGGYDPYSASKACCEIAIRSYIRSFFDPENGSKTLIASARAGNVIGGGDWSRDRLVPDMVRSIVEKNEQVILRNPDAIRPWQHVLDPLNGYLMLAKGLHEGRKEFVGAWNFAPEESSCIPVEQLVKKAVSKIGKGSYRIEKDPSKHEMKMLRLDASKAKAVLGWAPRMDIEKSLDWTFGWYGSYYSRKRMDALTGRQIDEFFG